MNSVVDRSSLVVGETDAPNGEKPVSGVVRCVVALTAYVTASMAIPVLLPAIISMVSIAGVLLAKRFSRRARHLMWFGAAVTSLWAIPFGGRELRTSLTAGWNSEIVIAIAASIALVIGCDLLLMTDALAQRRTTNDQRRS